MPLFTNAHIWTVLTTSVLPRQPIELKEDIHGSMKTWCDRESAKKKKKHLFNNCSVKKKTVDNIYLCTVQ